MSNFAAVMPKVGHIEIRDVGDVAPGPRQAVVQIEAVGVCGSDTAYFTVGYIGDYVVDGPIVLGHECAGTVVATGSAVTQVNIGDRVAIEPGTPCRDCRDCMAGRYHLCTRLKFLATPPDDGSLVQRIALDERQLFRIPDAMSFEEAAMCEPLSVGIWACQRAGMRPGEDVLVSGCGPVGLLAAQAARACGAGSVRLSDVSIPRLEMAEALGFQTEIAQAKVGSDVDVLLECSGAATALADGLRRLRTNGRAAMVGMPKQAVNLPLSTVNVKELTISLVNRYAHTWPTAITLISTGRVDAASIITHHFSLSETAEALLLSTHVSDSMKAVICPQQEFATTPAH